MPSDLYNTIDALSRERGINPQIVVSAVEDAIVVATRKSLKTQENLRAVLDKESGEINVYAVKNVVAAPEEVQERKKQPAARVEIELANVEKANLVPEL